MLPVVMMGKRRERKRKLVRGFEICSPVSRICLRGRNPSNSAHSFDGTIEVSVDNSFIRPLLDMEFYEIHHTDKKNQNSFQRLKISKKSNRCK